MFLVLLPDFWLNMLGSCSSRHNMRALLQTEKMLKSRCRHYRSAIGYNLAAASKLHSLIPWSCEAARSLMVLTAVGSSPPMTGGRRGVFRSAPLISSAISHVIIASCRVIATDLSVTRKSSKGGDGHLSTQRNSGSGRGLQYGGPRRTSMQCHEHRHRRRHHMNMGSLIQCWGNIICKILSQK